MQKGKAGYVLLLILFLIFGITGCANEKDLTDTKNTVSMLYTEDSVILYAPTNCTVEIQLNLMLVGEEEVTVVKTFSLEENETKTIEIDGMLDGMQVDRITSASIVSQREEVFSPIETIIALVQICFVLISIIFIFEIVCPSRY